MMNLMYLLGQVSGVLIIKKNKTGGRNFIKVEQAVLGIEGGWQKEPDARVLSK